MPVISGTTGTVTKGLKNLETVPGKRPVDSLQWTRDITHDKESGAVWDVKSEWWGAPLVQEEKYQGKGNLWQEMI
jgi:hypothetical protein